MDECWVHKGHKKSMREIYTSSPGLRAQVGCGENKTKPTPKRHPKNPLAQRTLQKRTVEKEHGGFVCVVVELFVGVF